MKQNITQRLPVIWVFSAASVLLFAGLLSSVSLGPIPISMRDSLGAIFPIGHQSAHVELIIQQVRLPRTLLAISVGAILAQCGAVMQGLFRNPLADPGIIGVSAGASLGAAIAIVVFGGVITHSGFLLLGTVPVFAFIGGALATFAIFYLGTSEHGTSVTIMLLAGVALGALAGAGMGFLNYFADDMALRELSLWSMGSLAGGSWNSILLAFASLMALAVLFQRNANGLNAMLLGEAEARHLGINVQRLKRNLIIFTAAGVGISVALCGMIGFIGLVVPHIARMLTGPNHKTLLPVSAVLGALLLLVADMLARIVIDPLEIPVGIVTAALGAPFFIILLIKQRGRFA